ncbi:MAG: helix-turn-helix domain-containing protein [Clostridia bacterium]|nr:helix-turn-helix domain-containing protein [Clostridia bacterium]
MSIGTTIKKLRHAHDMTQEQLAEYLGITANAVSQWECDRTAPDISQLPLLAYILDVSTDELLGVDLMKNEEKIAKIIDDAAVCYAKGDFAASADILRSGLKQFPKSHRLMAKLAESLGGIRGCGNDVISLCMKVIEECTDNDIRDSAFQTLIYQYKNMGKRDEAIRYAKKMSHMWVSQEDMLMYLLEGEEARANLINYVKFCSGRLMMCLGALAEHPVYSAEEKIALDKQCAAVAELLYPDGDYHYYAQYPADAYEAAARRYAEMKDAQGTLEALEKLCKFAIHFDTYAKDAVNTSPAVRGYCDGGWIPMPDGNYSADKLKRIREEEKFDFIREEPRYLRMMETLAQYAE